MSLTMRTAGARYWARPKQSMIECIIPAKVFLRAAATGGVTLAGTGFPIKNGLYDPKFGMATADIVAQILPRDATHVLWIPKEREDEIPDASAPLLLIDSSEPDAPLHSAIF